MIFKPTKSRNPDKRKHLQVTDQRILTEQSVKDLGRVFDVSLADGGQRSDVFRTAGEDLELTDRTPLSGRFKNWILQFVMIPRLVWPLISMKFGNIQWRHLKRK